MNLLVTEAVSLLDAEWKEESMLKEGMLLESDSLVIRKQIWAVDYPERVLRQR